MIFWGVVKKLRLKDRYIAILGLLLLISNMFLLKTQFSNYYLQAISGLFLGTSEFSEFPFLTWIFYPLLGYFFAQLLIRTKNKKYFYKKLLQFSTALLILISFILVILFKQTLGFNSELEYYHHNIFTNVVYGLFCIFWMSVIFFSVRFIPKFITKQMKRWSKNVTEIYFIHWVLIGWLSWFLFEYKVGIILYLVMTIVIFVLSDMISMFLINRKNRTKIKNVG